MFVLLLLLLLSPFFVIDAFFYFALHALCRTGSDKSLNFCNNNNKKSHQLFRLSFDLLCVWLR